MGSQWFTSGNLAFCHTKNPIGSWAQARRIARRMNQHHDPKRENTKIVPYRCRACGEIHLGNEERRQGGHTRRQPIQAEIDMTLLRQIRHPDDVLEDDRFAV